jgi:hypothetical protein
MLALAILVVPAGLAAAESPAPMTVWKSPWCGCCGGWIEHVRASGFAVEVRESEDLDSVKNQAAIPEELRSCHTAMVGGYVIEGHVPAGDIERLLAGRPDARGLAVPGMPSGSPGMEDGTIEPYDVLLLNRDGTSEVFSSYR